MSSHSAGRSNLRIDARAQPSDVTLSWVGKRPYIEVSIVPCELAEIYGVSQLTAELYLGENASVLAQMAGAYRGKVKLVYLDPPYDSQADYTRVVRTRGKPSVKVAQTTAYRDRWQPGAYLQYLYERLLLVRELLSDDGTLWVHCDWHRSHHIRSLLDEVFGSQHLINEVVWSYKSGGRSTKSFGKKHDTLFWVRKGQTYTFNANDVGETRGVSKRNNMRRGVEEDGRIYYSIRSNGKEYRYYEDDRITPTDVWEMSHLHQRDPERVDYPTQKPEKLLERIILASTNPGDLVLDPFMGSGTTLAVALSHGRRAIGCDQSMDAVHATRRRLLGSDGSPQVVVYHQPVGHGHPSPAAAYEAVMHWLGVRRGGPAWSDGRLGERAVKLMPLEQPLEQSHMDQWIASLPAQRTGEVLLVCLEAPGVSSPPWLEVLELQKDADAPLWPLGTGLRVSRCEGVLTLQPGPAGAVGELLQTEVQWRSMIAEVAIDWTYDGVVFRGECCDCPVHPRQVMGVYRIPSEATQVCIRVIDILGLKAQWVGGIADIPVNMTGREE